MIWSRRQFLETMLAATVVAAAPRWVQPESIVVPVFTPLKPFDIYEMTVSGETLVEPTRILVKRGEYTLLPIYLTPRGCYRWIAAPRTELAGQGLWYTSTPRITPLDIWFSVRQSGEYYTLDRNGNAVWLGETNVEGLPISRREWDAEYADEEGDADGRHSDSV